MTRTTKPLVTRKPRASSKAKDVTVSAPIEQTQIPDSAAIQPQSTTGDKSPGGKLAAIVHLMQRETGASIADLTEATGWQPHSIRGAIAGAVRKKGFKVISTKSQDGVRVYRIEPAPEESPAAG